VLVLPGGRRQQRGHLGLGCMGLLFALCGVQDCQLVLKNRIFGVVHLKGDRRVVLHSFRASCSVGRF
jgi:hypothetical protein